AGVDVDTTSRPSLRIPATLWDGTTKGLRLSEGASVTSAQIARCGWNALRGDLELPAMVLHEEALSHNIELFARFCREAGVELAPHAKTTMSPEIMQRQLDAGAWALTAAT